MNCYLESHSSGFVFCLSLTRIEEFAKEKMDLTLATSLEFTTPLSDLSDVKTMMDSINVVPGLICTPLRLGLMSTLGTDTRDSKQPQIILIK